LRQLRTDVAAACAFWDRLFWVNFCSVWWGAGLSSLNALDAAADDTVSASIEATATATAAIGTY
jgi:hypothetical protein